MIVITSGNRYIDIDAYASIIAYANLLKIKGEEVKGISTSKLNESINENIKKMNIHLDKYFPSNDDNFIILDVSDSNCFDDSVINENIVQIIDHHPGYEKMWKDKLGENTIIEEIGSTATIIFEMYEKFNLEKYITKDIAILLMAAILDNTLDLKAQITKERDRLAYEKLKIISEIENYNEIYFNDCQKEIEKDLKSAIINDTKIGNINELIPTVFSQLTIWNKDIIFKNLDLVYDTLDNLGKDWIMNCICLEEGKSFFITKNEKIKTNIEKIFKKKFDSDIMSLDNVWLRKEIVKKLL